MPKLAAIVMFAVVSALAASGVARAQSATDDDAIAVARQHFQRAERLFATGQFESAVIAYQQAYDAAPLPEFLFNIGQCYRQLRRHDEAIFAYQKYLQEKPDTPARDYVERTIEELERERDIATARRLRLAPASPGPESDRPVGREKPNSIATPIYKRWWFITGAVLLAGAATTTGIVIARDGTPSSDLGTLDFRK